MKQLLQKFKKRLIGATVTIALGTGSLIFSYTADGCNAQYITPADVNGEEAPADINGIVPKGRY